jgi:hypothetical protein
MLWGTYRDDVIRYTLKDTLSSNYNWSDAELLQYANWGLAALSDIVPILSSCTLTGSGPTYTLPADFNALNSVILAEDSQTTVLQPFDLYVKPYLPFTTPDSYSEAGYLLHYPTEGMLYISPYRASGSYALRYFAYLTELTVDNQELQFTYRRWLSQALAYYIGYCAHLREGVGRAALEQWSQRPDLLVKNPLNAEAAEFFKAYKQLISDHKGRD